MKVIDDFFLSVLYRHILTCNQRFASFHFIDLSRRCLNKIKPKTGAPIIDVMTPIGNSVGAIMVRATRSVRAKNPAPTNIDNGKNDDGQTPKSILLNEE